MIDGGEDPFLQAIHLEQGDFAWLVHVTWACWPVVAKLDRLGRNVAFLSALLRYGVEFVACDNPAANKLTLHILAAVAEAEAEATSARTKAALAAYKARGGKLGASLSVSEPDTRGAPQGHSGVGSSTKG
ncbi:recombinase family protein, partial [Acidimicrobium ferrooxidans]|nr:recombinase family protein [Acidimicrobium ferrooxidans]